MIDKSIGSLLSEEELLSAVKGNRIEKKDFFFSSVATDSRNVKTDSLFVPLVGESQDGHIYIRSAVEKGASVVFAVKDNWEKLLAEDKEYVEKNACVVFVKNTLYALQDAAAAYVRKFPGLIKIGITGSNGKTTTKEIAVAVLSQKYNVVATEGNFNSETGLPLSVFNIRKEHEVGIFEMGMNRRNEIGELASVLCPSFAIITNIGTAHIGILGSKDNIAEEKKKIFSQFKDKSCVGFVPASDEYASFLSDVPAGTVRRFGVAEQKNVTKVHFDGIEGTFFEYCGLNIKFPLPGEYNFANMLAVVALAETLSVPADDIRKGIESVKPLFGRSRVLRGKFTVVQDCYNANAESMAESLRFYGSNATQAESSGTSSSCAGETVAGEDAACNKIFVLGDMLELGDSSAEIHRKTGELAVSEKPYAVFFIGQEMVHAYNTANAYCKAHCIDTKVFSEPHTDDAAVQKVTEKILELVSEGDLVLVKGSRGLRLERIASVLCEKAGVVV